LKSVQCTTVVINFLIRFRRAELRLTRIEAFSDGVFAIIVIART
jgi:hypothetical protein